jgi:hypothetical protein
MTGEAVMWESELTGGDLPMVCVVTGDKAVTWISFRLSGHRRFFHDEGGYSLPVCAGVRRRARLSAWWPAITYLGWPASFAASAIVAHHVGVSNNAGLLPGLLAIPLLGAAILATLAWLVVATAVAKSLAAPFPKAARDGFSGGERWYLVRPVHPRFAAAMNRLPRARPWPRVTSPDR